MAAERPTIPNSDMTLIDEHIRNIHDGFNNGDVVKVLNYQGCPAPLREIIENGRNNMIITAIGFSNKVTGGNYARIVNPLSTEEFTDIPLSALEQIESVSSSSRTEESTNIPPSDPEQPELS